MKIEINGGIIFHPETDFEKAALNHLFKNSDKLDAFTINHGDDDEYKVIGIVVRANR